MECEPEASRETSIVRARANIDALDRIETVAVHEHHAEAGQRFATIKEAFEPRAKASGMTWEQWQELLASRTHARRLMTLAEMANVAVFMASDRASGMTGTTVNLTMGSLDD